MLKPAKERRLAEEANRDAKRKAALKCLQEEELGGCVGPVRHEASLRVKQMKVLERMETDEYNKLPPVEESSIKEKRESDIDLWFYYENENPDYSLQHCIKEIRFHRYYQKTLRLKKLWCEAEATRENNLADAYRRFAGVYQSVLSDCEALHIRC